MRGNSNDLYLIKYADDTALVASLQDVTSPSHTQYISHLTNCFDVRLLDLNVSKTKEQGGRKAACSIEPAFMPVKLKGQ